ncbi:hypothetical protein [Gracilimonas mengyeensis]|uniref:Uncharacterized protein n=1 Tax=Gracilimonas mengyeensis TaxID=1302730 RepID=A0A521AE10_9BACT|nr:hypothetical protein [Gracilimonas mengyeensis]SMO33029.1 hypothetical protein SAMN06265219_10182 [Gracilimonas mengyeensis]
MISLWLFLTYLLMEALINGVFHVVSKRMKSQENRRVSIFKGILERLLLIVGLIYGYPQVIIAFGALKIGTRFQKNSKISNDYFLIGNFISLLTAILFAIIIKHFTASF